MKHNPQAVTSAIQLYFSGESLRNTQKSIRLLGVQVSHQTVYNWISKYITLMQQYVEKLKPNLGEIWRADELWVKIKGDMKYLFALMDDETRYLIAQEVADTKYKHDARNIFNKGKKTADKIPATLITDGLPSYHDAFNKEFYTNTKPRAEHVNTIRMQGDMNNNKMESSTTDGGNGQSLGGGTSTATPSDNITSPLPNQIITVKKDSTVNFIIKGNNTPTKAQPNTLSVTAYNIKGMPVKLLNTTKQTGTSMVVVNLDKGQQYILLSVATWLPQKGSNNNNNENTIIGFVSYSYRINVVS
jgi:transposase-like protein